MKSLTHVHRHLLVILSLSLFILSCSSEKKESVGESINTSVGPMAHLADNSFQDNGINERFIPVLDNADDVALGARFDTLTGRIIGSSPCIADFKPVDRGNQSMDMRLVEVTDTYSQMKALDIDASVQASYFGASANAKAKFVSNQTFTQQSQNYLLYARADRIPRTINPGGTLFDLTPAAKKVLGDRNKFRTLCGDAFIVAIFEGIELYGMLTFNNVSQNDKTSISNSLSGSYAGWSASIAATHAVDSASAKGKLNLTLNLAGRCHALGGLGGDNKKRWETIVNAAGKLPECAETGANMVSFKVVPYSSALINDWPYDDDNDPDLNQLLYYYSAYGALLDSINLLITHRENAYETALLHRGVELQGLDELATRIRQQRGELVALLKACQSNPVPMKRPENCTDQHQLQSSLDKYPHPYVYHAQLPLFFSDGKPTQAFWSDEDIKKAILQENVQHPRDVACSFADKSGAIDFPACPADFDQIKEQAKKAINVTPQPWPRDTAYMFQTQSTSTDLCMVAPTNSGVIAKASTCNLKKPSNARQRMGWRSTGQLYVSHPKGGKPMCVEGRNLAVCDTVKSAQLWRFVPSISDSKIGRLQNAEGICLGHSNTDRNVTYKRCSGDLAKEEFYLWKPIQVK